MLELDGGRVAEKKSRKERIREKEEIERCRREAKEWYKDLPDPEARKQMVTDYVLRRYLERGLDDPAVRAKDMSFTICIDRLGQLKWFISFLSRDNSYR